MKTILISFHGQQEIKDAHVAQLQAHYNADEIVQGKYWENGKGCDTGCSFHSSDHNQWAIQLGVPVIIGRLRDKIFEGLPNDKAKEFPLLCSNATPVGVNLENVWRKFMIWLLVDTEEGVIKYAKTEASKKAIQDVADAFADSLTKTVPVETWRKARNAAAAAAAAAAYAAAAAAAAYAAADAAAYADAADAAAAAAYAAYAAAAYAAYADADAAAAYAAYADAAAARKAKYIKMSEKLIELLKEAK